MFNFVKRESVEITYTAPLSKIYFRRRLVANLNKNKKISKEYTT